MIDKSISQYSIACGIEEVKGLCFRKCKNLMVVSLPDGLISIGDAAFSYCDSLKQLTIPASVTYIGVAAFCMSGLEELTFKGVPDVIDNDAFIGCNSLKKVKVPIGAKDKFIAMLDINPDLIVENNASNNDEQQINLFGEQILKRVKFDYNRFNFNWAVGDVVNLEELFSGPTALISDPSYQFRRKAIFIFMKVETAKQVMNDKVYDVPANTAVFRKKYEDKYGNREPRIFIFTCDDGKQSKVYDEVKFLRISNKSITVKSLLRL